MNHKRSVILMALVLLIGSCKAGPDATEPTPAEVIPGSALISEVMAGAQGNNSHEFIELFNPGEEPLDLEGWSIWYRLATSEDDLLVFEWSESMLLPPQGHLLLGRDGQDLGIMPDVVFTQALNTGNGALELRGPTGNQADALGWGGSYPPFTEGTPAAALSNGVSLERAPGGEAGNGSDHDDNATDFILASEPSPQNSGSPLTPAVDLPVQIELQAPASVEPGSSFDLTLHVRNQTDLAVDEIVVRLPLPAGLTVGQQPDGFQILGAVGTWTIGKLEAGAERSLTIGMVAPWRYITVVFTSFRVEAEDAVLPAFGSPQHMRVEGGVIPVGIARSLMGDTVTVVGSATMYTGGFYAGSSGTKFYLQDDSGGIQVYVPGGMGVVDVQLGDQVQVTGYIELYRGSIELIPLPEDVLVLDAGPHVEPSEIGLSLTVHDPASLCGELITVQGIATRAEEFSYSYEVDLVDDQGNLLLLYLDKLTEMSAEPIDVGHQYRAVGILDRLDTNVRLYPRVQDDLIEVFAPALRVAAEAPVSILPGETFTVTLRIFNHTADMLEDITVWANPSIDAAEIVEILDGGDSHAGSIEWHIDSLEGEGTSTDVRFRMTALEGFEQIVSEWYGAQAEGQSYQSEGPLRIFVGTGVPIWAIQGERDISPYKLQTLTTRGVVTGVFPELFGFWIQEIGTDEDEATSAGLFISREEPQEPYTLEDLVLPVSLGDMVEVTGQVREISQQTQIRLTELGDVTVLAEGTALPLAIQLDPPVDETESQRYYEAREGMLVRVDGPALAVSPISRYGEAALVLPRHGVDRLWRDGPNGMMIMVDDGSEMVHYDRSTLPYVIQTGDQVENLWGPLAYTYGQYKIEPLDVPQVTAVPHVLPSLPALAEDELGLMTWNVENLFDILDPHPADLPVLRRADYDLALAKIANTILAAGAPTIVGLQEVEHLGILEDLAELPSLAEFDYQPFLLEGTDSRGIDVCYLVRGDRVSVLAVEQFPAAEGLTSRPPLLLLVEVSYGGQTETLYLLNNHFTSLSGGELATEPRRTAQAAWNVDVLGGLLAADPGAHGVVMGDLNSFYDSLPIEILRESGLMHVFEALPPQERYTYIFQGISQTLDHILVTPELMDRMLRVDVLRTNADYAPPIPGDVSPLRKSDHDAVVVVFSLAQ